MITLDDILAARSILERAEAQATRQVETQPQAPQTLENNLLDARVSQSSVTVRDLTLLRELWEYCDNYGDGADDSGPMAIAALNFAEPLRQLIARLESKN